MKRQINFLSLSLKNIHHYIFRYGITFVILFLMNIFVFASSIIINGAMDGIEIAKNKIGADLVISSKTENFDEIAENVMYEGLPQTLFVDKKYEDLIKKDSHVTSVVSRLYLATLKGASCCDDQVQLIATDFSNDFLLATVVDSKELGQNEIILGSKFAANVGEKVKYYGREFVVKEKIEKTGTGYDISGFISYESAKSIMEDKQYEDLYGKIDKTATSIIFVNSDNPEITKNIIESQYGKALSVYSMNSKLSGYISTVGAIKKIVFILDIFLFIIGFCAIFGITLICTDSRKNECGSLLLLGKTKAFVWGLFTLEQVMICLLSVVTSVIITLCIKSLFIVNIESLVNAPVMNSTLSVVTNSLIIMAIDLIIVLISTGIAIYKLYKVDPCELIKESA